jgi:hypothetical protein
MVALVLALTAVVEIVKVPVVAPAAIETEAGTVALVELLVSETVRPPVGAAEPTVAVPVLEVPPSTLDGETVMLVRAGAVMVRVAVAEVLLADPVMVDEVFVATAVVETVKVAVVAPAATETEAGTVALVEVLLRETVRPPVGAALVMVTVPVDEVPPATLVGLRESDATVGAVIVKVPLADVLLAVPVIVSVVVAETATVVTVKVAVVAPAATVTEAGSLPEELVYERVTTRPPEGAMLEIVTVPVLDAPPVTLVGLKARAVTVGAVMVRVAV